MGGVKRYPLVNLLRVLFSEICLFTTEKHWRNVAIKNFGGYNLGLVSSSRMLRIDVKLLIQIAWRYVL